MKNHRTLFLFATLLLAIFPARADDTALTTALTPVRKEDAALADELQRLAEASPAVRRLIVDDPHQRKSAYFDQYLWEYGYRAVQQDHWNFARCLKDYPHVCEEASLVACLHAGDGRHYAAFRSGLSSPPIIATADKAEDFTFSLSEHLDLDRYNYEYDYEVKPNPRGDILLARWHPRVYEDSTKECVVTEYLYVDGHDLKRLKTTTKTTSILSK